MKVRGSPLQPGRTSGSKHLSHINSSDKDRHFLGASRCPSPAATATAKEQARPLWTLLSGVENSQQHEMSSECGGELGEDRWGGLGVQEGGWLIKLNVEFREPHFPEIP